MGILFDGSCFLGIRQILRWSTLKIEQQHALLDCLSLPIRHLSNFSFPGSVWDSSIATYRRLSNLPSVLGAVAMVLIGPMANRGSEKPSPLSLRLSQPPSLFGVSLVTHTQAVGGRTQHFLLGWQGITSGKWVFQII